MKIKITESDIRSMVSKVAKLLRESSEIEMNGVVFNPDTGKWKVCADNYNELMTASATLGDGPIFRVTFSVAESRYEDTSFDYAAGMDSGTHHEGYDVPETVEYEDSEYIADFLNGEESEPEDDNRELSEEEIDFIESEVNKNPRALMAY